ncbi:polysaccharide deacetylase family protein [Candidatus Magnetomonas plexicatena]|uniref:polysaccharide deacetylase family protein n=1 Tax=Candidatus Magnetomonas plexicatena TaxID=2552947 RepID=UPI001C7798B0|nr:polysaccharide deacetylase family protein [Nitrospirales bacterium LBB_01]
MSAIPILMYHHVNVLTENSEKGSDFITVDVNVFERQMAFLKREGYTTLTTTDFLEIRKTGKVPPRPVIITFDDGWLDNWVYAYPILKLLKLKAVFFVITAHIASAGLRKRIDEGFTGRIPTHKECVEIIKTSSGDVMMSWEELRQMELSGLIDVQSHTHTHHRWDAEPDMLESLYRDIASSRAAIEEHLNKNCTALCWPWGIYTEDYIKTAEKAGFSILFTTEKGTNTVTSDIFRLKRIPIGNIGILNFRKKLFINSHSAISSLYYKILK